MKITRAQKIAEAYSQLKDLDAQCLELEKTAEDILKRGVDVNITFSLPKEKTKENILDEDGSVLSVYSFFTRSENPTPTTKDTKLAAKDFEALAVIGTLLSIKNDQRKELLNYMNKV